MKEVQAYKSINGTIYQYPEQAQEADERTVTERIERALRDFVGTGRGGSGEWATIIAGNRDKVRELFAKHEAALREAEPAEATP